MTKKKITSETTTAGAVDFSGVEASRADYQAGAVIFLQGNQATSVMYVDGPMMTADVSVTPFDRLLPRGAASVYVTVNEARPPAATVHRLSFGLVTSSAVPSGAVAANALTCRA